MGAVEEVGNSSLRLVAGMQAGQYAEDSTTRSVKPVFDTAKSYLIAG